MKLLIVDDEEHVREGIQLAIDWSQYEINEILMAENGLEAMELVRQHQPEIIISDMSMHTMDGPAFLERLREEGWSSKVIVLSGYQQFNYTRATLLAKGVDYLLKPFKISDLDAAIQKAYGQIKQEQEARLKELSTNFRLNEVSHLVNEQRFARLIEEEQTSIAELESFLTSIGLDHSSFYVATFLPRNKETVVKRYYARDEQLMNFAIKNIVKELVEPLGQWSILHYEPFIIVMISSKRLAVDLEATIHKLQEAWQRTLRLSSFVAFRAESLNASQLQSVLLEEKSSILSSNILDDKKGSNKTDVANFFIDKERVIVESVLANNKQYLFELVDRFSEELGGKAVVSLRELQHYTVEINLLLMRIYAQLSDERFYETMPLWMTQLEEWATKLKLIFHNMIATSKAELSQLQPIVAVRNYINDHMKEDITLAGLAETFHFSPQYLAKKFKEEYDTTIMNYLTQLRMDKAGSLLAHTELPIQEIASESGFEELNYFSKVFKKYTGLSPTSYRKKYKV